MKPENLRRMEADRALVERYLEGCFLYDGEPQQTLFKAMRYSLLAGGKRLRPILTLNFARACGGTAEQALPFAAGSLDLIALPHTLELCGDAHAALREVQRTLAPEGKVAITGINPFSFWGWRHARARLWRRCGLHSAPWLAPDAALIAHWRLREWLQLLGFEVDALHLGCWLPALRREGTLARFAWLDALGSHCAPAFGAVYVILATRRVYGMRQLPAAWRRPVPAPAFGSAAAPSSAISGNAPQKASHD